MLGQRGRARRRRPQDSVEVTVQRLLFVGVSDVLTIIRGELVHEIFPVHGIDLQVEEPGIGVPSFQPELYRSAERFPWQCGAEDGRC